MSVFFLHYDVDIDDCSGNSFKSCSGDNISVTFYLETIDTLVRHVIL